MGKKTKNSIQEITFGGSIHFFGRIGRNWNFSKKGKILDQVQCGVEVASRQESGHLERQYHERPFLRPNSDPTVTRNGEGTSIVSGASSRKGTRIARLASLFSNRSTKEEAAEAPILTPESTRLVVKSKNATRVSPPQSESSNDYSGWPGTQDKRGGTVAIQSSYDDSSVGAAGVSTFHRKKYDLNMDENDVEEEVRKWMNDPSFDDSTVTDKIITSTSIRDEYVTRIQSQQRITKHFARIISNNVGTILYR